MKNISFYYTIKIVYIILKVLLQTTCYTLAAMSIDRCFYIVLPTAKLRNRTPQTAFIVCICIWTSEYSKLCKWKRRKNFFSYLGSLALIFPYHIVLHKVTSNFTCSGNNHSNFLVCFVIFCSYYALPLFIIIVCYTKLAMHVMQSNRLIASQMKNVWR